MLRTFGVWRTLGQPIIRAGAGTPPERGHPQPAPLQTTRATHHRSLARPFGDTTLGETREELRLAIVVWIETKYNRRRQQRALGKLTPAEFEMIYTTAEAA